LRKWFNDSDRPWWKISIIVENISFRSETDGATYIWRQADWYIANDKSIRSVVSLAAAVDEVAMKSDVHYIRELCEAPLSYGSATPHCTPRTVHYDPFCSFPAETAITERPLIITIGAASVCPLAASVQQYLPLYATWRFYLLSSKNCNKCYMESYIFERLMQWLQNDCKTLACFMFATLITKTNRPRREIRSRSGCFWPILWCACAILIIRFWSKFWHHLIPKR